jgi:hypothetical protein
MRLRNPRLRLVLALVAVMGIGGALAPSAFSATSGPIAIATARSVKDGTYSMRVVVQCEAVSKLPALFTEVSCTAADTRADPVRLPGQTSASAATESGFLRQEWSVCVRATTYVVPLLSEPLTVTKCSLAVAGQATVVAL